MQRGFAPILIVLLIAVLVIGGIFVFEKYFDKSYLAPEDSIKYQPTPIPSSADETANWKTYIGSKLSFKYPPNLYAVTGASYGDPYVIGIVDNANTNYTSAGFIVDESLKNNSFYNDYTKTVSTFKQGLINAQTKTSPNGGIIIYGQIDPNSKGQSSGTHIRNAVFHFGDGAIVVTSVQEYAKYIDDATYEKIVNSIKITDQAQSSNISNWKVYGNTKYGYSLKYPTNWQIVEGSQDSSVGFYPPTVDIKSLNAASPYIGVFILDKPFAGSPKGNKSENGIDYITDWKNISVGGAEGHYYKTHECAPNCVIQVDLPFAKGSQTFTIFVTYSNGGDVSVFDQIVSTFRFTN